MNKFLSPAAFRRGPESADGAPEGMSADQKRQIWSPIKTGGLVIGVFFVAVLIWASVAKVSSAVRRRARWSSRTTARPCSTWTAASSAKFASARACG